MPKAKKSSKGKKFDYTKDRKKLKKKLRRKLAPTIECAQIRKAWDDRKTVQQNLRDMGLQHDSKTVLPIHQPKHTKSEAMDVETEDLLVVKPYVVRDMEAQASIPVEIIKTLSRDLMEYAQHMVKEHGEDYKAMARDEKNYYQDTPKQIKRKIEDYKRYHPDEYSVFMQALKP
ncbi:nucleolar protein 16 [Clupea harengus]|uniref:Nucleolar protein 16 n=1 Tax=Clupea harengus TaxID=7950 RepID=A0A6P3WDH7_CLUHA|nr:nucleolar protein 16 [Clupea harengus]